MLVDRLYVKYKELKKKNTQYSEQIGRLQQEIEEHRSTIKQKEESREYSDFVGNTFKKILTVENPKKKINTLIAQVDMILNTLKFDFDQNESTS